VPPSNSLASLLASSLTSIRFGGLPLDRDFSHFKIRRTRECIDQHQAHRVAGRQAGKIARDRQEITDVNVDSAPAVGGSIAAVNDGHCLKGILASKLPPAKLLRHPAATSIVASDDPLARNDRDAQAWFHACELEYQLGRQDEADAAFARALEIRPGYGRPRQFLNRPRLEK